jgi:hypothetical protein
MTKSSKTMKSALANLYNKAAENVSRNSLLKTDLLYSKPLLYIIFVVSLINLLIWVVGGDIINVIVFLLVGFLTAFFSKNMIVILLFALVISNIIKFGLSIGQEGFSEGIDDEEGGAEGMGEEDDGAEGMGDEYDGAEGMGDEYDDAEGMYGNTNTSGNAYTSGNTYTSGIEGMQTLGYEFILPSQDHITTILDQQNKLMSNLSNMNPYVINADNEAKLRSQIKYSEYTK